VADLNGLRYTRAGTVEEALQLLERFGPRYMPVAGGTDLLVGLRRGWYDGIEGVVDIARVDALRGLDAQDGQICIGSCATHAELAVHDLLRAEYPALASASAAVGSPQIRNRGTIGGNIVGAAPCADTVPALLVAGALVEVVAPSGTRSVSVDQFITGPYTAALQPHELTRAVVLPRLKPGGRWGYERLARRGALDRARMSVVALAWLDDDGRIDEVRIAPGAVLPKPRRLSEAEGMLRGKTPTTALLSEAARGSAAAVVDEAGRRWSAPYKQRVLATLVRRALEQATAAEGLPDE
jgi:CO/xanthine dehydrogenase FAD-binding subunit